jgi:hypothetical protein
MDTMRGSLGSLAESTDYDRVEDEAAPDTPPAAIGQDERRMQVRAYNLWASLLGNRNYPAIEDLEPGNLPDFGPYSALLDFTGGIENPGIAYLGEMLAEECGAEGTIRQLSDVPRRSLLSRITDHYMQILANQAPIGFEAEFVNQRGATILYRGILLPFSSDDDTIDFIYGVINWKELADAQATDELLLEIDQALEPRPAAAPNREEDVPLTDWADGPGSLPANDPDGPAGADGLPAADGEDGLPLPAFGLESALPASSEDSEDGDPFALAALDEGESLIDEEDESEGDGHGPSYGSLLKMPLELSRAADKPPVSLAGFDAGEGHVAEFAPDDFSTFDQELDPGAMGLGDWLAAARELAVAAHGNEDRTRTALYQAIGRAYDFSLAAARAPREFEELLADAALTVQGRAPMTPVVKLVFGADYDKTRLTEYAAVLSHAHRLELPLGAVSDFLGRYEGGLKGVVKAERRLRREEAGKPLETREGPRPALARKLRAMRALGFEAIAPDGSEFALVMIRRAEAGEVVVLGEVPDDVALVERAARRLIG